MKPSRELANSDGGGCGAPDRGKAIHMDKAEIVRLLKSTVRCYHAGALDLQAARNRVIDILFRADPETVLEIAEEWTDRPILK